MSIADFLFPAPTQRVLSLVYAQPAQVFRLNELLDRAGSGRGNGQRLIQQLLDAGVLVEEPRRGRQRAIRANQDFPLYPELAAICRKTFGVVEPIREALEPFAAEINEAFVFGSIARGEDTHRSDIDLLVVGKIDFMAMTEAVAGLEKALGRQVHLNAYAPEEWDSLKKTDAIIAEISTGPRLEVL